MSEYDKRVLKALESSEDVFGQEVLAGGEPSYDRVKDYLRPLKLADWSYGEYPLVLSDIRSTRKARALCSGSQLHLNIRRQDYNDGVYRLPELSVEILVGPSLEVFGNDQSRLEGPKLLSGWLPIYEWSYCSGGTTYHQLVFAMEEQDAGLVVYWKLMCDGPGNARVRLKTIEELEIRDIRLIHKEKGDCWARFSHGAEYDPATKTFSFSLSPEQPACLAIPNEPAPWNAVFKGDIASVNTALKFCVRKWERQLECGAKINVPEPLVNNAYRAVLCGTLGLINNSSVRYSAHSFYDKEYASETPNTILTLALFGQKKIARDCLEQHATFVTKKNTEYNDTGWQLRSMCEYYLLTSDDDFLENNQENLKSRAEMIINNRKTTDNGLPPKCAYAWDHNEILIHNLVHYAMCWRGLRDLSVVMKRAGRTTEAELYAGEAASLRKAILDAVDQSAVQNGDQVFIPIALLENQQPFKHIPATVLGTYYNIAIGPVVWTWVFPPGSSRAEQLVDFQQHRGGVMLGLLRVGRPEGQAGYPNENGINDIYGLPRALYLLAVGKTEQFLLSFYSKIAHGLTRDTFIGAEGTSVKPVPGEYFRRMGRPPNSFSNANLLQMLRYMLVMERDTDDDGEYEQLWLCSGTPRAWLEPGKEIKAEQMPTAFGELDMHITASKDGKNVAGEITIQRRNPAKIIVLTLRLPGGKKICKLEINGKASQNYEPETGRIYLTERIRKWKLKVGLE